MWEGCVYIGGKHTYAYIYMYIRKNIHICSFNSLPFDTLACPAPPPCAPQLNASFSCFSCCTSAQLNTYTHAHTRYTLLFSAHMSANRLLMVVSVFLTYLVCVRDHHLWTKRRRRKRRRRSKGAYILCKPDSYWQTQDSDYTLEGCTLRAWYVHASAQWHQTSNKWQSPSAKNSFHRTACYSSWDRNVEESGI